MLTLAIETSCDETAVAVLRNKKDVLSNIVSSSVHLHSKFGGIVPEIASRFHVEYINYCIKKALKDAKVRLEDINLVAVTYGPGLVGALLVGVSMAKAISFSMGIPLIGVNHLLAHIYVNTIGKNPPRFPFVGLVISGGHTSLIYMKELDDYKILGQTQDDAAGEAFDKAAKILGLGYPGGPAIEKKSRSGDCKSIAFTRTYLDTKFNFSFSGIKTALLYKNRDLKYVRNRIANMAASFQEVVVDIIVKKTIDASIFTKTDTVVVGGGVSANLYLKNKLTRTAKHLGIKVYFPLPKFSLDNAVMIAMTGYEMFKRGRRSNLDLAVCPNLGLESL